MSDTRGVIAIVTLSDGHVTASHADFKRTGYGGFKLSEAQCIRAGDLVKRKAVCNFVGPAMTQWLSGYTIDQIWSDMREKGGARLTYVPIGWDGEDAECVTRRSERP